ncbi:MULTISPECIES: methionyl-tRNA formyltransferase [unclassified Polaromonas]|uniref:methionyl-tRNA formyltransferase n=1 Tax=unclassified Polaromonas TaxID=2638319 RepID=UPI0018CB8433|nr:MULTISPECIES: methionyl-tRNA formyltransferase [unclassified Polaromonas]MBG6073909.1 methionyl-tRNA formyltransferase [Polaromonas sp. CG_9.7]MBG6115912.1 methionyl-tRNA formyltransferase [Polaromonas sp. CG_9.2]MDH6183337.1 methionyl-tRNA formyltransferase [Polaromonas sp. CG_23.6]
MRVIFAGTPDFARVALAQLHSAGFEIPLVLSQPDRPAGRGLKLQASAVKLWAQSHQIPVVQPRSLRLDGKYPEDAIAARDAMHAAQADAMVVAAYGLILPQWVLDLPRLGCFNIHASLLPRWRGAAPIHRAIQAGDRETGITLMQMDAGLDTGDMLGVAKLAIQATDTTGSLHDRLAALGGQLVVQTLNLAGNGQLHPVQQPTEGVSYAHKIEKAEAAVDWTQPVAVVDRHIRAMTPFPGASTQLGPDTLKLWKCEIDSCSRPPDMREGQILSANAEGVRVVCRDGVLVLTELQRAGGKRLGSADFLRGFALAPGMLFGK